jgi:DNA (cytosine-5)-methyltransferase 1
MTGPAAQPAAAGEATLELFAGPGGFGKALRDLRLPEAAYERDWFACKTRRAAGLPAVQCDVTAMRAPERIASLVGSPPCPSFSRAGLRAAQVIMQDLAEMIQDAFTSRACTTERRSRMTAALHDAGWPPHCKTFDARQTAIARSMDSAMLVSEPARFIAAAWPEWVVLEQVPAALPLWQVYAGILHTRGYSTWTGVLNAADYGVPQKRLRAFLIASRARQVACPLPTHYDADRYGPQLWGDRWISMADAIGWGCTSRPAPTVTAGGTDTGGPEVFGSQARVMLAGERDTGGWIDRPDGSQSLNLTPAESGLLQGFPADWPWQPLQGGKGRQIQQAGNAVPPPLGAAVIAEAAGLTHLLTAAA